MNVWVPHYSAWKQRPVAMRPPCSSLVSLSLLPPEVVSNPKVTIHALTCCYRLPWAHVSLNARWFCFSHFWCLCNEVFVYFMTSVQRCFDGSPCSNLWVLIISLRCCALFLVQPWHSSPICSPGTEHTVSLFPDTAALSSLVAIFWSTHVKLLGSGGGVIGLEGTHLASFPAWGQTVPRMAKLPKTS